MERINTHFENFNVHYWRDEWDASFSELKNKKALANQLTKYDSDYSLRTAAYILDKVKSAKAGLAETRKAVLALRQLLEDQNNDENFKKSLLKRQKIIG